MVCIPSIINRISIFWSGKVFPLLLEAVTNGHTKTKLTLLLQSPLQWTVALICIPLIKLKVVNNNNSKV